MGITRSVNTANDPRLGPIFSFKKYERSNSPFYNKSDQIDFVTWGGNLYVCVENGVTYVNDNPANHGFLLLIEKGQDGQPGAPGAPGKPGPMPNYTLKFDGKQLVIIDQNGVRKAVSPELTGPSWFPELQGHTIVWRRKEADDTSIPQNIDLDELRPVEECPILLRLNSDNTKREAEKTGPGYYIQWKREGADEWTNLMSISELMNIALAGVCFWWDDAKDGSTDINGNPVQTLHFGHKQVIEATYDASKLGNKRIADVTLGDVLFDAGEIPFANYDADIAALNAYLCDLQDDLNATKASIPTKVSQLINDVPYIKTINGHHPNTAGELKLKTVDNIDLIGEGNIPFATINGRPIANTEANFVIPSDYLTESQLKTVGGQSLIKTPGSTDIGLRTINGESIIGSSPLYVGTVKSVSVNGGTHVTPDSDGNVNIIVSGGGSGVGDGVGIDDIAFQVNSTTNKLEYRVRNNGVWDNSWTPIDLPAGTTGGENIALKIEGGVLYLSHNGQSGPWDLIGTVNNGGTTPGTGGDPLTYIKLKIEDENGVNKFYISYNNGSSWTSWGELTGGSVNLSNYYTKSEVDALIAGGGGGTPGISYRTWHIFHGEVNYATVPERPSSVGTWNVSENTLTNLPTGWVSTSGNVSEPNIWMSMGTFRSDTGALVGDWSSPIRLISSSVTVTSDQSYYKASAESTGVTAPATDADPTLAANGSWSTNASSVTLTDAAPYLWMFHRVIYSTGNIYQSDAFVIRYLNNQLEVDYERLAQEVEGAVADDITDLTNRISAIETTGAKLDPNYAEAAVGIITNYVDSNQKSFADLIVDGKEAQIKQWAGAEIASELSTAGTTLNGMQASITNAATKSYVDGQVTDVRSDMNAGDAAITNTVLEGTQYWAKTVNGQTVTQAYSVPNNQTISEYNTSMTNAGWELVVTSEKLSVIQQQSDKIWMAVGDGNDVKAAIAIIGDAETSGGKIQLTANEIELDGQVVADAINAKYANVGGGAVVLGQSGLTAIGANIEGTITAGAGSIGGVQINSDSLSSSNYSAPSGNRSGQGYYIGDDGSFAFYGDNGLALTDSGFNLPSDFTISWNDLDSAVQDAIEAGGSGSGDSGLTQSDVEDIIDNYVPDNLNTLIGNNYIQTGHITANDITSGTLDCSNITVTNLTTDEITLGNNAPISNWSDIVSCSGGLSIWIGGANDTSDAPNDSLIFIY